MGVIDSEFRAAFRDGGLVHGDERSEQADAGIGPPLHGIAHGEHERLAAIRIDRVIAGMRGDDHRFRADAFGKPGGDGEHDAVAEGHDGLFHRFPGVVAFRNLAAGAQEVGFEKPVHEIERYGFMGQAEMSGMPCGAGKLAGVVFRAVVE